MVLNEKNTMYKAYFHVLFYLQEKNSQSANKKLTDYSNKSYIMY